jgi:nucleoside-diphosphate-sugar epimerase
MTIAITGSSGFIGSSLIPFLTTGGHRVVRLIRSPSSPDNDRPRLENVKSIQWNRSSAYAHASL